MFTIVLLLYLQLHLEVTLEGSSLRGAYRTRAECEEAAARLRGPLPTPRGYAAAWHDAVCLPIGREVRVNELAPLALGTLLRHSPPEGCAAEGAWRRAMELCTPSGTGAAGRSKKNRPRERRMGVAAGRRRQGTAAGTRRAFPCGRTCVRAGVRMTPSARRAQLGAHGATGPPGAPRPPGQGHQCRVQATPLGHAVDPADRPSAGPGPPTLPLM